MHQPYIDVHLFIIIFKRGIFQVSSLQDSCTVYLKIESRKNFEFRKFNMKQFWQIKTKQSNNFLWKIFITGIQKFNANKSEAY